MTTICGWPSSPTRTVTHWRSCRRRRRDTFRRRGWRERANRGEKVLDCRLGNVPGDEDEAAGVVGVGPRLEFDRRVRQVLDELHHHRPAAAGDIQQSLDAQQV